MRGRDFRLAARCVLIAIGSAAGHAAQADVVFCNQFNHTIYVAIAYQQSDGSWLSRGWLELDQAECRPFDTALRLSTFYYRAESAPYTDASGGRAIYSWGSDRSFAIWADDNFNYWGAENRVLKSSLALFRRGPETTDPNGLSVTISFRLGEVVTTLR